MFMRLDITVVVDRRRTARRMISAAVSATTAAGVALGG